MKKIISFILIFVSISLFLGSGGVAGAYVYTRQYKHKSINSEINLSNFCGGASEFYCYDHLQHGALANGAAEKLENWQLSGNEYKYLDYDQIPKSFISAAVAIEDKRFWSHSGVDFLRSAEAGLNYILLRRSSFGASTITQQLIKNLTGNDDISIDRKLGEIFSALNLEKELDKTEILEMYLNIINFSDGCKGIYSASRHYYSKEPKHLSLSEVASIIAITNNPSYYNPIIHPENNKRRRDIILDCMESQGYISKSECISAKSTPIELKVTSFSEYVSSWYEDMVLDDVISDLCEKYGINRETASLMMYSSNLKIYTAVDKNIQKTLENYYANESNFPKSKNADLKLQSAMIICDPYTGDILAVAGATGKKGGNRIQNYATDTLRPPGSTLKPLSVYAPAFENGLIKWSSIVDDSPIENGDTPWPKNATGKYIGQTDISYAVKNSLNTISIKLLHELGNESSLSFLKNKLNINNLDQKQDMGDASLALGQPSHGITLSELVSGYTIFADGVYKKPRSYFKVTDRYGNILLDNSPSQNSAISEANAAIMTKLLQNVITDGSARGYISLTEKTEVAGKTGTTQNNCDRLFVGYTPTLLAGVWCGYDYPQPMDGIRGNISTKIWDRVMCEIYSRYPEYGNKKTFDIPSNVRELSYDITTGSYPCKSSLQKNIRRGWFEIN